MKDWKEYKLKDLTTKIGSGATPTGGGNAYKLEGISLIRSQNVLDFKFSYDGLAFIDDAQADGLKNVTVNENDVLLNITGDSVARACKVPNEVLPARVNQHVCIIRADEKNLNNDYLLYFLQANKELLLSLSEIGGTRNALTKVMIEELVVLLPDYKEQQTIAEVLSSLDDKINLLNRQNKTLERLAETIFRQLFFTEEWKGSLSEYIKVQGGYAFKSKDFKEMGYAGIIKITNISMEFIDIKNSDFVDESVVKNIDTKFKIKSGDFLIAMTGAEIGKIGIVEKTEREIWVNQRVGKLEAKVPYGNIIGYLALKSREGQDHIINACSGSAQENISTTGIEEMVFASYNPVRANLFGQQAQPLFEKVILNLNQITVLNQFRDTLLPKLMNGEIRVKN